MDKHFIERALHGAENNFGNFFEATDPDLKLNWMFRTFKKSLELRRAWSALKFIAKKRYIHVIKYCKFWSEVS